MNERQSFIIEYLDEKHVVIEAEEEWRGEGGEPEAQVRSSPDKGAASILSAQRTEFRKVKNLHD